MPDKLNPPRIWHWSADRPNRREVPRQDIAAFLISISLSDGLINLPVLRHRVARSTRRIIIFVNRSWFREFAAAKAIDGAGSAKHLHPPQDKIVMADWNFQTRSEHTVIQLFRMLQSQRGSPQPIIAHWWNCATRRTPPLVAFTVRPFPAFPRPRYYHRTVARYCHRTSRRESE